VPECRTAAAGGVHHAIVRVGIQRRVSSIPFVITSGCHTSARALPVPVQLQRPLQEPLQTHTQPPSPHLVLLAPQLLLGLRQLHLHL
jgi:hypothetical protein